MLAFFKVAPEQAWTLKWKVVSKKWPHFWMFDKKSCIYHGGHVVLDLTGPCTDSMKIMLTGCRSIIDGNWWKARCSSEREVANGGVSAVCGRPWIPSWRWRRQGKSKTFSNVLPQIVAKAGLWIKFSESIQEIRQAQQQWQAKNETRCFWCIRLCSCKNLEVRGAWRRVH